VVAQNEDLERARRLVLEHGRNATAYQILNPGIALWFSHRGDAVAGYVRRGRFLVIAGAPVTEKGRLAAVVSELERHARSLGCNVCYFGAETLLHDALSASSQHTAIVLGAQPVWNPARWAQRVGGHASLRAQLRRARNKGVTIEEWACERAAADAGMHRCLEHWLSTRRSPAMHFLVEPRTLKRLYERRVFVAQRGADVVAFLIASPVPRRSGWLIEQIVRGEGAVNGTSELLVDAAMHAFAASGADYVTLGLSPLSQWAGRRAAMPLWLRGLLRFVRAHGRRFYNFEGLDAFKAKMQPDCWEPVFAIVNQARFSPAVLYAIAGAFTGRSPIGAAGGALAWALRQEAGRVRSRIKHGTTGRRGR